jgi:hypothetical protein
VHLQIICHNIFVSSYNNHIFCAIAWNDFWQPFFGSSFKKCQQAFLASLPGKHGWLPFENRWLDTLMRLCNLAHLLKQIYPCLFLSILFAG